MKKKIVFWGVVFVNIACQSGLNVSLPLALSDEHTSMSALYIFCCMVFLIVVCFYELVLDLFFGRLRGNPLINRIHFPLIGLQMAISGCCMVFAGSSSRTPLLIQMTGSLFISLLSPFFKFLVFRVDKKDVINKELKWFLVSTLLFTTAFGLVIFDKTRHFETHWSWFFLLYMVGLFFGVSYNVHQEFMMREVHLQSTLETFQTSLYILKRQIGWQFLFSWLMYLFAIIPGADQAGTPFQSHYAVTWSEMLKFRNIWINVFVGANIITISTNVYINKHDSSFNLITSNIAAVISLWTGWLPSYGKITEGYLPSYSLVIPAILLSVVAIYPSYRYSLEVKNIIQQHCQEPQSYEGRLLTAQL
eukprot:TRINITY_DN13319_c0_g3_i1.p1 TRINITY_DN13319_c0_g3~~TRINITY_DN13319_c0_g3_i1.p1  ORF type:complete len:372 (-),score=64.17 TRINITY_DN13319_c0_g3_i1:26-1108(-)